MQILRTGLQDAANAIGKDMRIPILQLSNSTDPSCTLTAYLRADAVTSAGDTLLVILWLSATLVPLSGAPCSIMHSKG